MVDMYDPHRGVAISRRHRHGSAGRSWAEGWSRRLFGRGTDSSGVDSHGAGLDGIRIRGGAFRALLARVAGRPTHSLGAVLWVLSLVRHRTHRRWSNREFVGRMA